MLNKLSVKLSLLFVGIALVSVGVIALWVNRSVQTEFTCYCQKNCQVQAAPDFTSTITMPGGDSNSGAPLYMGEAEQAFLSGVRNSLWLAALVAILTGVGLGYFFSRLISGPMRQLTLAARKVATGDFSQRVSIKTDDEIGEVSVAFNTMAEQLAAKEKSRRRLLADIAHELRNPLSIIQGNLEAWLDGVITPAPDQVASVYDETVLLSRLITDLRDLSLAEAGQLKLYQNATELGEFIFAEITSVQNRCQEKQISISADLPHGLPLVLIDKDRIRQVLHNLVDNALRYTPAGGAIKIGADYTKPGWVMVSVSDTGSGIPSKDLPHVFDHFYKADRSRQRGHGGAGIGLAMVKRVVELHGGTVWVKSRKGKGTTFYFTLPVA
ncbi:MAG: HAMP domain-containing sensor histidine kinase [Dehalococcoidia bacterium]|jgi:signal transduction histidine kinase